jgi:hypothetical protein
LQAGALTRTGNGAACESKQELSLKDLRENRRRSNMRIVSQLREDEYAQVDK